MSIVFKAVKGLLGLLILVGIIKGLIVYNKESEGGIVALMVALIDGMADFTIYLIPNIISFIREATS